MINFVFKRNGKICRGLEKEPITEDSKKRYYFSGHILLYGIVENGMTYYRYEKI